MALSAVVEAFKKMRKERPAGMLKGATGSLGSRTFQARNSQRGEQKELELMQSPVFKAFMAQQVAHTPMADYLAAARSA